MADNRKIAMDFLMGKGLTRAQAAGTVGSLMQESGLRTNAVNPSSGATGIGQWLGGRKANLMRQGDLGIRGQLNFLWSELQGPERAALERLQRAHTVEDAAAAFTWGFERPGRAEANMANRIREGRAALSLAGAGGGRSDSGSDPVTAYNTTTTTTPGVDNRVARAQLIMSFLGKGGKPSANPLEFAMQANALRDVAPTSTTVQTPVETGASSGTNATRATKNGAFNIDGPNPGRLSKGTVSFARQVAGVLGMPLEGLDGSSHSKYTVNGNVSEHYSGHATDIFKINGKPARGQLLIDAGRAALIAAGMPRAKAMKQTGGLFNVGDHQIIFNTMEGGDHYDHLHVSTHSR